MTFGLRGQAENDLAHWAYNAQWVHGSLCLEEKCTSRNSRPVILTISGWRSIIVPVIIALESDSRCPTVAATSTGRSNRPIACPCQASAGTASPGNSVHTSIHNRSHTPPKEGIWIRQHILKRRAGIRYSRQVATSHLYATVSTVIVLLDDISPGTQPCPPSQAQ